MPTAVEGYADVLVHSSVSSSYWIARVCRHQYAWRMRRNDEGAVRFVYGAQWLVQGGGQGGHSQPTPSPLREELFHFRLDEVTHTTQLVQR